MYRIGIMEQNVDMGTQLEQWFLEYGEKMQLDFDVCRWKFEDEVLMAMDEGYVPDVLFLHVGDKVQEEEKKRKIESIWKRKVDGRTREAKLHPAPKEENPDEIKRTGIELGRKLRERADCKYLQLVYFAPKKAFYDGLIQLQPLDLVIRPVTKDAILASLRKAVKLAREENDRLSFHDGKNAYFVPFKDILYIGCNRGRVLIKMAEREVGFHGCLRDVIPQLPKGFMQIHRSYAINFRYVLRYEYEYLEMTDGEVLSISRPNRKIVRRILLDR